MVKRSSILAVSTALALLAATQLNATEPILGPPDYVLTQRNDTNRTGAYHQSGFGPQVLAPENGWSLLGVLPVDGVVWAQPLYVPNADIGATAHNFLIVATARNNLYAFEADTLNLVWQNLTLPRADTSEDDDPDLAGAGYISPTCIHCDPAHPANVEHGIGIQSTPVIDPLTGLIYLSYRTRTAIGHPEQHVAIVDLHTGKVLQDHTLTVAEFGGVDGSGNPWNPISGLRQRASLLLSNGVLYVAFASHTEIPNQAVDPKYFYRGQILALDAKTLHVVGRFQAVPNDKLGGGIWMASTGIAADENGDLYFTTGNTTSVVQFSDEVNNPPDPTGVMGKLGTLLGISDAPAIAGALAPDCKLESTHACRSVADAAVRLKPIITTDAQGNIQSVAFQTQGNNPPGVFDFFMPYRALWHNWGDFDLGSAGVVVVPGTHELVFGGKEGVLYIVNRDTMGGYDTNRWSLSDLQRHTLPSSCNAAGPREVCNGSPVACPYVPDEALFPFCRPGAGGLTSCQPVFPLRDPGAVQKVQLDSATELCHPADGKLGIVATCARHAGICGLCQPAFFFAFLYVWPEKSALQVFERDASAALLHFRLAGRSAEKAPAGGADAMPGGFISLAVDPAGTGIVFASVPASTDNIDKYTDSHPGRLYAFDPIPDSNGQLRKLWDNSGDPAYGFAKFVPPTLGNGRVYLATSTNEILVYGMATVAPPPAGSGGGGGLPHHCGIGNAPPCLK